MRIGYARVSKADGSQSLDLQRKALRAEGIDDPANLYPDFASGGRDDRPGLDSCVRALRKGDVLVVWKLGRLGRPRSLGAGRSRSRRPHPSSASDSTNRTRSACREMGVGCGKGRNDTLSVEGPLFVVPRSFLHEAFPTNTSLS